LTRGPEGAWSESYWHKQWPANRVETVYKQPSVREEAEGKKE